MDSNYARQLFSGYLLAHLVGYGNAGGKFGQFYQSIIPELRKIHQRHHRQLQHLLKGVHINPNYAWAIADRAAGAMPIPKPMRPLIRFAQGLGNDPSVQQLFISHEICARPWKRKFGNTLEKTRKQILKARLKLPPDSDLVFVPMLLEDRGRARMLYIKNKYVIIVSRKTVAQYPEYQIRHELFHIALDGYKRNHPSQPYPMKNAPVGYGGIWPKSLAIEYIIRGLQYAFDKREHPKLAAKKRSYYIVSGFKHFDDVGEMIDNYMRSSSEDLGKIIKRLTKKIQRENR